MELDEDDEDDDGRPLTPTRRHRRTQVVKQVAATEAPPAAVATTETTTEPAASSTSTSETMVSEPPPTQSTSAEAQEVSPADTATPSPSTNVAHVHEVLATNGRTIEQIVAQLNPSLYSFIQPATEWCKRQLRAIQALRREQAELSKIWTAREQYRRRLSYLHDFAMSRDFSTSGGLNLSKKALNDPGIYRTPLAVETAVANETKRLHAELSKLLRTQADVRVKLAHLSTLSSDEQEAKTCPICFEDLVEASLTPCLHTFCSPVRTTLVFSNLTCPTNLMCAFRSLQCILEYIKKSTTSSVHGRKGGALCVRPSRLAAPLLPHLRTRESIDAACCLE